MTRTPVALVFGVLWERPRSTAEIAAAAGVDLETARGALEELAGAGLAVWTRAVLTPDEERAVHDSALAAGFAGRYRLTPRLNSRDDPNASPYIDDQERAAPDPNLWRIAPAAARLKRRSTTRTATPPHTTKTRRETPTHMSDIPREHPQTDTTQNQRDPGDAVCARHAGVPPTLHRGAAVGDVAPPAPQLEMFEAVA